MRIRELLRGRAVVIVSGTVMAKSRPKGTGERASKGTARRTLSAARFFLDQAGRVQHPAHQEYYVQAAILFACMALEYLGNESGKKAAAKAAAKEWIKEQRVNSPLIRDLEATRDLLSHEHPIGIVLSQREEGPYSAVYEMLPDQLNEIETIVDVCERQFR